MSETPPEARAANSIGEGEKEDERTKRFRFKSKSEDDRRSEDDSHRHRRRHHEASHSSRKRHRFSRRSDNEPQMPNHHSSYLASDDAFRESLFDAMGDDEGAAFWENVYGQPIHNYPNTYEDEETGELERMTDDEYAQFVRRRMWEKSWEGIEAVKEEKRRERESEKQRVREEEKAKDKESEARYDDRIFDTEIAASLRRGERRKERKRWLQLWEDYLRRWDDLKALAQNRQKADTDSEQLFLRNKIAWPVETGKSKDINREEIERFVRKGTASYDVAEAIDPFANAIKAERVQWHPDKIQQRYGFMEIDENTLKSVTATFQVFDDLWTEIRGRAT